MTAEHETIPPWYKQFWPWFLIGLLGKSYWAVAIPVAILVFFVLGLTFWVGWTIATIEVEPFEDREPPPPEPAAGATSDRSA